MRRNILLVRHCEVGPEWRSLCYGKSDVGLSPEGEERSIKLAAKLAALPITHLFHSGLKRTSFLAELVAEQVRVPAVSDTDLRERDFGTWELRAWDAIYAEVGGAMDGLVLDPATYAPPEGETTWGLRDRVLSWYGRLPLEGVIVAITHGGPTAALRGALLGWSVPRWAELIPPCGSITQVP
jgi:broad specificity phosphatase PhoE